MNLKEVRQDGEWICYKTESPQEAMRARYEFNPGNYDLVPHKEKRSRNANSYAWELIGKIAAKIGLSPVEVYRNEVEDVSAKSETIWCESEAVEDFKRSWCSGHLGREVKVVEDDGTWSYLLIIYGSSDFDKAQMAQLIDHVLQDCQALEIETKQQGYIDSLLEEWNEK